MKKLLFLFLLLSTALPAQVTLQVQLLNAGDSAAMAFTNVHVAEADLYAATDEQGKLAIHFPKAFDVLHLEIAAIGCHTTLSYRPLYTGIEKIYVHPAAMLIREVEVQGLSAKSIVKKAIAAMPQNYADSSYADESFYRQYEKVDRKFTNLLEAQLTVMFNLSRNAHTLQAKEAFAVKKMRRNTFEFPIDDLADLHGDECSALFALNPVYHLAESSLNIKVFDEYDFSFDTLILPDAYVIDYVSPGYSSESHGIANYSELDLRGESREYVKLVIDKESFAIRSFERTAVRNVRYNYPKNNNFIVPSRHYTCEFVAAHLLVDYRPQQGKWYLQHIFYDYTNAYFRTKTYERSAMITDVYEWTSGRITHEVPTDLLGQFYFTPYLSVRGYTPDPAAWQGPLPDFYFYEKDAVIKDVEVK